MEEEIVKSEYGSDTMKGKQREEFKITEHLEPAGNVENNREQLM